MNPPPDAPMLPNAVMTENSRAAFKLAFKGYSRPGDTFGENYGWAVWQHGLLTDIFRLLQKDYLLENPRTNPEKDSPAEKTPEQVLGSLENKGIITRNHEPRHDAPAVPVQGGDQAIGDMLETEPDALAPDMRLGDTPISYTAELRDGEIYIPELFQGTTIALAYPEGGTVIVNRLNAAFRHCERFYETRIRTLERELAERDATFALRWKADNRAIARWRKSNPGNDLVMPDHADLVVWLLGELTAAQQDSRRLEWLLGNRFTVTPYGCEPPCFTTRAEIDAAMEGGEEEPASEPAGYDGHIRCKRCGKTHWLHFDCENHTNTNP